MPLANSYCAARVSDPKGLLIPDVLYIEKKGRFYIYLKKVGDVLDLERVDIRMFVKSSLQGALRTMFVQGTVASVQMDVSERVESEIHKAMAEFKINPVDQSLLGQQNVAYKQLEPGVMVAVANTPEISMPPANPPALQEPPKTVALEPGVTAPGAVVPKEDPGKKVTRSAAKAKNQGTQKNSPWDAWKDNKDFQTQKRTILESKDSAFLNWVAGNETKQFQKLARTRLAELGS